MQPIGRVAGVVARIGASCIVDRKSILPRVLLITNCPTGGVRSILIHKRKEGNKFVGLFKKGYCEFDEKMDFARVTYLNFNSDFNKKV